MNNWPNYYELEDMVNFIKKYENVFIYGVSEDCEYLLKYFDLSGIQIKGYIETNVTEHDFVYRPMTVTSIADIARNYSTADTAMILGLHDFYYEGVVPNLRRLGYNYFAMTEHNKRTITYKLRPKTPLETHIEIPIVEHCNLNCKMCSYFAPLAEPQYYDVSEFAEDMRKLSHLCDHQLGAVKILGGEPLLHPDIVEIYKISRESFPESKVVLITNGTLLLKPEFFEKGSMWEAMREYKIDILMTVYPVKYDMEAIKKKAEEYGVEFEAYGELMIKSKTEKMLHKGVIDPNGAQEQFSFIRCVYLNLCVSLRNGNVYPCPPSCHIHNFNHYFGKDLKHTSGDMVNLAECASFDEISSLASTRVPFCSHCANKDHGRLFKWETSKKSIDEWINN